MKNELKIKLEQNWENISGVSEKSRAEVSIHISEAGMTIYSNGDRFDNKPQWMTLSKEDSVLLAKQIIAFLIP